jgi:hypothetical protein
VIFPLPLSMAVAPVTVSSVSLDEPQAANSIAHRTTVKTRMNLLFSFLIGAPRRFRPRPGLYLAGQIHATLRFRDGSRVV